MFEGCFGVHIRFVYNLNRLRAVPPSVHIVCGHTLRRRRSVIVRTVLRAVVVGTGRIHLRLRVAGVRVWRLLLRIDCARGSEGKDIARLDWMVSGRIRCELTGHQVLQVQLLLLLAFAAQTDGRTRQQNGGNQAGRDARPGNNVRPVVRDACVVAQHLHTSKENILGY